MTPRALVSGAGIAGLACAYWLRRIGWEVDIVERAPAFRDGGQNIDVRGVAREVVERMGLTEAIRARNTTEEGTRFVDADGGAIAEFPKTGEDGPTAELEILRGDLAGVLRDALGPDGEIRYGAVIAAVSRRDDSAVVAFDDGAEHEYDLVIVAEGVRSTTRDLVVGEAVETRPLELAMVYGTIPRGDADDRWWNWYVATRSRQTTTRPDPVGTTRATLAYISEDDELTDLDHAEQMRMLRERFEGAGWETARVLDGFEHSADVYVDYLTQIRAARWSEGPVVLVGDAAWCVTPLGGGGCSLALTGAYVLAAQLSQHPDDRAAALAAYEEWMRPLTDRAQKLPPGMPRLFYPSSRFGVAAQATLARLAGSKPVREVVGRRMGEVVTDDRPLPALAQH